MVICIFWDCIVYIEIIVFRALLARIQAIPYANSWASVYVAAAREMLQLLLVGWPAMPCLTPFWPSRPIETMPSMAVAATDQGLIYAQCLKIVASSSVFRRLFHAAQDCHSTKFCPGSIKLSYLGFFGSWRQCGLWLRRVRQRRRSPQHCILSWAHG